MGFGRSAQAFTQSISPWIELLLRKKQQIEEEDRETKKWEKREKLEYQRQQEREARSLPSAMAERTATGQMQYTPSTLQPKPSSTILPGYVSERLKPITQAPMQKKGTYRMPSGFGVRAGEIEPTPEEPETSKYPYTREEVREHEKLKTGLKKPTAKKYPQTQEEVERHAKFTAGLKKSKAKGKGLSITDLKNIEEMARDRSLMEYNRLTESGEQATWTGDPKDLQLKKTGDPQLAKLLSDPRMQKDTLQRLYEKAKADIMAEIGEQGQYKVNDPVDVGGETWYVVGFDKDGEPLVDKEPLARQVR